MFSKLIKSRSYNVDNENNILGLVFKDFELEDTMLLLIILDITLRCVYVRICVCSCLIIINPTEKQTLMQ